MGEFGINLFFLICGKAGTVFQHINAAFDEFGLLRIADIHELKTDGAAINFLQMRHDFTEFCTSNSNFFARLKFSIQVSFGEAEIFNIERRTPYTTLPNGIGFGKKMSAGTVGGYQVDDFKLRGKFSPRSG